MPTKDPEKLREKWRRNKETQRARQGSGDQGPSEEDKERAQHQRDFGF